MTRQLVPNPHFSMLTRREIESLNLREEYEARNERARLKDKEGTPLHDDRRRDRGIE